jgi:hypothetical protein
LTYNAVKLGSLVSLWPANRVLALACAKLTKIFGGFGSDIFEELKCDSAKWFAFSAWSVLE